MGTKTLISIEGSQILGSLFGDTFVGGSASDSIDGFAGDDEISGRGGNDFIDGGLGGDVIRGGEGDDQLYGDFDPESDQEFGGGNDTLFGEAGNDFLFGGVGTDTLDGGAGIDTARVDFRAAASGVTFAFSSNQAVLTSTGTVTFKSIEAVEIVGSNHDDALTGGSSGDFLDGGGGNDRLKGGGGNDFLDGFVGDDTIIGDGGGDQLFGGAGNDRFVYHSLDDSRGGSVDNIRDLESGDIIDLSDIDANQNAAGNQAFTFIGDAAFSNGAGELRATATVVQGDVNGDGIADFQINLQQLLAPGADFFDL
jgi:serralysin